MSMWNPTEYRTGEASRLPVSEPSDVSALRIIPVAAGVLLREGAVFLARRGKGESMSGFWEFPGGKLEQGETLQTALEREWMEELGLQVRAGEAILHHDVQRGRSLYRIIGVWARLLSGEPELRVHDRAEWVPLVHCGGYRLGPADAAIAGQVATLVAALPHGHPLPGFPD